MKLSRIQSFIYTWQWVKLCIAPGTYQYGVSTCLQASCFGILILSNEEEVSGSSIA